MSHQPLYSGSPGIRHLSQASHSRALSALCLLAALSASPLAAQAAFVSSQEHPPAVQREFRGAWVATVANIDWPSKGNYSVPSQKAELLAILDRARKLRLNAIIFQVRPGCDALYASQIEPWSEYLTGAMGKAPEPFWDPLAFAVTEAHARGLELHAWFNPYRARHSSAKSPVSSTHISRTRPALVKTYGSYLWLDPGEKAVQDYSLSVVRDVVRRYDVDAVHFDDYFYPYKERTADGKEIDFPDDASWNRYRATGKLSRDDWRRENVNTFIQQVHTSIKQTKPWVQFGISPFGIWRPGFPKQIQGHDAYAKLYADSRKWLNNGWLDYCAPQLYWRIDPPEQSFPVLLKWWNSQNTHRRHVFPGLSSSSARSSRRAWATNEIQRQIDITRKAGGAAGHIHWNMSALKDTLGDGLAKTTYTQPALPPAATWLDRTPPQKPALQASTEGADVKFTWSPTGNESVAQWVIQTRQGKTWNTEILPANRLSRTFASPLPQSIAVSAVDRSRNQSKPTVIESRRPDGTNRK